METIKTRLAGKKVSYEKRDKMKRKKKKRGDHEELGGHTTEEACL
jgi:hypothetical protein